MNWQIEIPNGLGGFAPSHWESSYPSYGNANMAGAMENVEVFNPNYIRQGPGLSALANGTQAGVVNALIKRIMDYAVISGYTFAIGGTRIHRISINDTVHNGATWPHTISHTGYSSISGEDIAYYRGYLYYPFIHSTNGDIGKCNTGGTSFDDDWGTHEPAGKGSLSATDAHPTCAAGNDILYIGNGSYVSSYDGTIDTLTLQVLDLPSNTKIVDLAWAQNRLWIATNTPNLTGSNKNYGSIYVWDGNETSWEDEIRINGKIGSLKIKGGIVFVFYKEIGFDGGYKLGYVSGSSIVDVAHYKGDTPLYYQVSEYKNHIIWNAYGLIWAWGSIDKDLPVGVSQLASGGYSTGGGLAVPFGVPLTASNATTNYKIAKFSGYETDAFWKSLMFDVTGDGRKSVIDKVRFNFEQLAKNARVDWILRDNQGTFLKGGTISHTASGTITTQEFTPKIDCENFRVELSWADGSVTNPVSIKAIKLYGHTI